MFRVERAHGPVWYAKYRLPDGREVQHNIGPAWTGCGRPAGYFTKRLADDWLRDVLHEARRRTLAGPGHGCREATGEPRRRHRRVLAEEVYALVGAAASEQDAAIFLTAAFAASTTATDFRPRAYLASLYGFPGCRQP